MITRSLHRLTSAELKGKKPGKYADGGGLFFYMRQDGGAQWVLRYTLFARRHEILTKTVDGVVLYGRGRDLPEFESALGFNPVTCLWSDLGRPSDVFGSETRHAIRAALKAGMQTPKEIADHGGLDYDLCAKTLQRMAEGGEIERGGRGRYRIIPDPLST